MSRAIGIILGSGLVLFGLLGLKLGTTIAVIISAVAVAGAIGFVFWKNHEPTATPSTDESGEEDGNAPTETRREKIQKLGAKIAWKFGIFLLVIALVWAVIAGIRTWNAEPQYHRVGQPERYSPKTKGPAGECFNLPAGDLLQFSGCWTQTFNDGVEHCIPAEGHHFSEKWHKKNPKFRQYAPFPYDDYGMLFQWVNGAKQKIDPVNFPGGQICLDVNMRHKRSFYNVPGDIRVDVLKEKPKKSFWNFVLLR